MPTEVLHAEILVALADAMTAISKNKTRKAKMYIRYAAELVEKLEHREAQEPQRCCKAGK